MTIEKCETKASFPNMFTCFVSHPWILGRSSILQFVSRTLTMQVQFRPACRLLCSCAVSCKSALSSTFSPSSIQLPSQDYFCSQVNYSIVDIFFHFHPLLLWCCVSSLRAKYNRKSTLLKKYSFLPQCPSYLDFSASQMGRTWGRGGQVFECRSQI